MALEIFWTQYGTLYYKEVSKFVIPAFSYKLLAPKITKCGNLLKMFLKPVWVGKIHGVEVYATNVVRIWWFSNKFSIF